MQEISVFNAKTHFSGIISNVIENDEEIIITKRGQPVAKIIPYAPQKQKNLDDLFKAMDMLAEKLKKNKVTLQDIRKMREEGRA